MMAEPVPTLSLEEANQLAADNIRLAYAFARRNRHKSRDPDDLLSCCMEALVIASRSYDASKGRFSTYAFKGMRMAAGQRVAHRHRRKRDERRSRAINPRLWADRRFKGPAEQAQSNMDAQAVMDVAKDALAQQEIGILTSRHIEDQTQVEVAALFGVTPQRVHEVEHMAIGKCRRRIRLMAALRRAG